MDKKRNSQDRTPPEPKLVEGTEGIYHRFTLGEELEIAIWEIKDGDFPNEKSLMKYGPLHYVSQSASDFREFVEELFDNQIEWLDSAVQEYSEAGDTEISKGIHALTKFTSLLRKDPVQAVTKQDLALIFHVLGNHNFKSKIRDTVELLIELKRFKLLDAGQALPQAPDESFSKPDQQKIGAAFSIGQLIERLQVRHFEKYAYGHRYRSVYGREGARMRQANNKRRANHINKIVKQVLENHPDADNSDVARYTRRRLEKDWRNFREKIPRVSTIRTHYVPKIKKAQQ